MLYALSFLFLCVLEVGTVALSANGIYLISCREILSN